MNNRQHRRVLSATIGLLLAVSLSGCSALFPFAAPPETSEFAKSGYLQNAVLADESEALLSHIWEGKWAPPVGGNVRNLCGTDQRNNFYFFYSSWFTPERAFMPADKATAELAVAELRTWLDSQGWSELKEFEFTSDNGGSNALGLAGVKGESSAIELRVAYYFEGQVDQIYPHVIVDIDSGCLIADR